MNYHQFWGERLETRSGLMKGVGVGSRKTSGPHFDLIPQGPQKIWVKCYWNWNSSNRRSVSKLPSKVISPIPFGKKYIHRVMVIFVMVKSNLWWLYPDQYDCAQKIEEKNVLLLPLPAPKLMGCCGWNVRDVRNLRGIGKVRVKYAPWYESESWWGGRECNICVTNSEHLQGINQDSCDINKA